MIPIITGVIASSIGGGVYFTYNLYTDCANTEPITLYSDSAALIVGTYLYSDSALTIPYDSGAAVIGSGGPVYRLQGGQITETYACFSENIAYSDCTQTTQLGTVFVEDNDYTNTGKRVSTNPEGTNLYSSQFFEIAGYELSTDGNGEINNVQICGT